MDQFFWGTIGFIFLSTIISAFIRTRQRDACLELIDNHFVTLVMTDGRTVWGDLRVFGRGLQLRYLAPHRTRRGLVKSSYLLYQKEMGQVLAACRFTGQLSAEEAAQRAEQIERTFRPGPWERLKRWWRNMFDTLRDAFNRALPQVVGRFISAADSKLLTQNRKDVEGVGKELLEASGHAYEPMLEAHIGQPVVVEVTPPGGGGGARLEIAGYLAEYTEHFVAVFNVEHEAGPVSRIEVDMADPAAAELPDGVAIEVTEGHVEIVNRGHGFLIVKTLGHDDDDLRRLGASVLNGAGVRISHPDARFVVEVQRVESVDMVCPRQHATIRYMGPDLSRPTDGVSPVHEDESIFFP